MGATWNFYQRRFRDIFKASLGIHGDNIELLGFASPQALLVVLQYDAL